MIQIHNAKNVIDNNTNLSIFFFNMGILGMKLSVNETNDFDCRFTALEIQKFRRLFVPSSEKPTEKLNWSLK